MMPNPKKEEVPVATAPPPVENNDSSNLPVPVKRIKLTPEGVNQAEIDAVLGRLAQMRKRLREDILFIGGRLAKIRDKMPHGRWGSFIERTFPLSIKTANIWIRAWENRDSELALSDWDAYMRVLYGNEPKKLKTGFKRQEDEEDRDDLEQSGGEGLNFGREETIFADKGRPAIANFKQLVALLEREFFQSREITRQAKLEFITALIDWLENQKKNLRA